MWYSSSITCEPLRIDPYHPIPFEYWQVLKCLLRCLFCSLCCAICFASKVLLRCLLFYSMLCYTYIVLLLLLLHSSCCIYCSIAVISRLAIVGATSALLSVNGNVLTGCCDLTWCFNVCERGWISALCSDLSTVHFTSLHFILLHFTTLCI